MTAETPAESIWPDFDAAMRHLVPDLHPQAIVYAVDAGEPDAVNTKLDAALVIDGKIVPGTERGRLVERAWLAEFCGRFRAEADRVPGEDGLAP
ncbi:hypothetical protein [Defluviimonas salinarum]|uniref:Uncharacterized protein n=1 Tax=Defluviimonas salinarum TaxID=2992147 RepID=A0ABT3J7A7_9RHOB|nr:hypothetical protein [Defluviimonas salinarum]MCW3783571.1 hypothetical protein [Defluviimonas salinarum]